MGVDFPIQQIMDGKGRIVAEDSRQHISDEQAKTFYEQMLNIRLFDRKSVNMQRQGRIGTYVPFEGQEASQVGSAAALETGDWMFPTYRDHGAMTIFGQSMLNILLYWRGRYEGCVPPADQHIFPPAVPIASQILHGVGAAWAEKKKGSDRVGMVYFGDGATSEGDFHEGMNFASVFQAPAILFNQNNGFAISVPTSRQMHSATIAQKALGYDMEGVRVDGNDVFAVYTAVQKAVAKARRGEGPTLIEAVTWRYGAHTTSDDPSKYRDNKNENERRRAEEDPLLRVETYLKDRHLIDDDWIQTRTTAFQEEIEAAVQAFEQYSKENVEDLFDHVFATPTAKLEQQKQAHLAYSRRES